MLNVSANPQANMSNTTTTPAAAARQASTPGARRTPGTSKLNKLFTNLERSIMNQFNQIGSNSDPRKSDKSSNNASAKRSVSLDQVNRLGSHTNAKKQANNIQVHPTSEPQSPPHTNNEQPTRIDRVSAKTNDSNVRSNDISGAKMMLNNINTQRRSSHQSTANFISSPILIQRNSYNGTVDLVNNINSISRLSIPPPHANDEARNQSQQHLFGAISSDNSKLSYDIQKASTAINNKNTHPESSAINNLHYPNKSQANSFKVSGRLSPKDKQRQSQFLDENHNRQLDQKSRLNDKPDDKEDPDESGFANFQSRRPQLFTDQNNQSTTSTRQELDSKFIDQSPANNMIAIHPHMMAHRPNTIGSAIHGIHYPINNYQAYQAIQHQKLHSPDIRQAQLPIPVISDQPASQSVGHFNGVNSDTCHIARGPQQPISHDNGNMISLMQPDGRHQLYTHAPPKPRRYQYHDVNMLSPPFYQPSIMPSAISQANSIATSLSTMTLAPNPSSFHPMQQYNAAILNYGHHLPSNAPFFNPQFNMSHYPQNLYPNHHDRAVLSTANRESSGASLINCNSNHGFSLPKSKSSLDAGDIAQYRAEKMNMLSNSQTMQRTQRNYQQVSNVVYNPARHQEYQIRNQKHSESSLASIQPGNLLRSKSVSHLLTETNEQNSQSSLLDHLYHQDVLTRPARIPQIPYTQHDMSNSLFFDARIANSRSSMSAMNINMLGLGNNSSPQQAKAIQRSNQILRRVQDGNHPQQQQRHNDAYPETLVDDTKATMGNRHARQYNLSSSPNVQVLSKSRDQNSHLIVDLTTPRVLAKTQTTISTNAINRPQVSSHSSSDGSAILSLSINQVGLPHIANLFDSPSEGSYPVHVSSRSNSTGSDTSEVPGQVVEKLTPQASMRASNNPPYYYSDLKSEEQRKALQNIVQQKSLSPPPQLLSRSTDQHSTRLTPRSATLHHDRLRPESMTYWVM